MNSDLPTILGDASLSVHPIVELLGNYETLESHPNNYYK